MVKSTKQYDSVIYLFDLLQLLSLKTALQAADDCYDAYGDEYAECDDCGITMDQCECNLIGMERDWDYDYDRYDDDRSDDSTDKSEENSGESSVSSGETEPSGSE